MFDADTLFHAVTLTYDSLILKVRGRSSVTWSKSVRNFNKKRVRRASLVYFM